MSESISRSETANRVSDAGSSAQSAPQQRQECTEEEERRFAQLLSDQAPARTANTKARDARQETAADSEHEAADGVTAKKNKLQHRQLAECIVNLKDREPAEKHELHPKKDVTGGDLILEGLATHQASGVEELDAPTEVAATSSTSNETLNQIVESVVNAIQVSDPSSGQNEVRISLKSDVLPETEFRISETGGAIQLTFVTSSLDSEAKLTENVQNLQQILNEKVTGKDVVVSVEMEARGQNEQQDGRSRQQRNLYDEWAPDGR